MMRSMLTHCHGRVRNRQRHHRSHRRLLTRLVALTSITARHVLVDEFVHPGPVESTLDLFDGLVLAKVTTRWRVVALLQDSSSQLEVIREVESISIVVEIVHL